MGAVVQIITADRFTAPELSALVDLIENKLDWMEVTDREDASELRALQGAFVKLKAMMGKHVSAPTLRIAKAPGRS